MQKIEKLQALRDRFGSANGADIEDVDFRKAASLQFTASDRRKLPYADPATLLDAPYLMNASDLEDFGGIDVALVGVPMDLGVTNRSGARMGPKAVRAIERVGPYEHVLRITPMADCKVADIGDVPFRSRFSLESCHEDIEAFFLKLKKANIIPLAVGGDHSISSSILRALGADKPVAMIHIDAHCDTSGAYEGCKFHHGGPFRKAVLDGVLDPVRTIQIGIRGGAEYLWEFSYVSGMTVIHSEEVPDLGIDRIIEMARSVVGDSPTYISFDIDSLDPAYAPGTGTPEIGGLSPLDVLRILRGLVGINIIGGDVVEVAPQYDPTSNTAQNAAQVLFELLCLVAANQPKP
ncbi:MAG: agmatinase [Alphaproteobacteria bacterium]|nr:agmatinase [Alphaproteobacteria bacterium]